MWLYQSLWHLLSPPQLLFLLYSTLQWKFQMSPISKIVIAFQKLFTLMQSHLSIFAIVACASGVISKNSLPRPMSRSFFLTFSFRSFTVSNLMFKSLIRFEVIFNNKVISGKTIYIVIILSMLNGYINLCFEYISCLSC